MKVIVKRNPVEALPSLPSQLHAGLQQQLHELEHAIEHITHHAAQIRGMLAQVAPIFTDEEKKKVVEDFAQKHKITLSKQLSSATLGVVTKSVPYELTFDPIDTLDGMTLDCLEVLLEQADLESQWDDEASTMYVYLQRKTEEELRPKIAEAEPVAVIEVNEEQPTEN